MEENRWMETLEGIRMPEDMGRELIDGCLGKQQPGRLGLRHARLLAACVGSAVFLSVCCPVCAAYHLYQIKNMDVFFEKNISQEQMEAIGEALEEMEGIGSVRFVSAEEAWKSFREEYLTPEMADAFSENPLAESSSYRVSVTLGTDTEAIRQRIRELDGVRSVSNLRELKEAAGR